MGVQYKSADSLDMSEKLCLKWKDFQGNVNTAFGILRDDRDFSDVTLACEDGHQVEAHKVILAASSPFFQNMLRKNKHPHPLIYMRGVKSEDLVAIVDFLYFGEANVYQENIDAFLSIAEELNLKGLTGNVDHAKPEDTPLQNQKPKREYNTETESTGQVYKSEVLSERTVALSSFGSSENFHELDEKVKSIMSKSENKVKTYVCNVCGKEGMYTQTKNHIEANHLEGISIPCDLCEKTFRSKHSLNICISVAITKIFLVYFIFLQDKACLWAACYKAQTMNNFISGQETRWTTTKEETSV